MGSDALCSRLNTLRRSVSLSADFSERIGRGAASSALESHELVAISALSYLVCGSHAA